MSRTCVTALRCLVSGRSLSPFHPRHYYPRALGVRSADEKGSLVDPQVCLDDLDCDRCRGVGAEAAPLDYDADGYLRVTGRREASEDRVVQAGVVDAVL